MLGGAAASQWSDEKRERVLASIGRGEPLLVHHVTDGDAIVFQVVTVDDEELFRYPLSDIGIDASS